MKNLKIFVLFFVLFSCNEKEKYEPFKLSDIDLNQVYKDSLCFKKLEGIQKAFFTYNLDKYKKEYSDKLFNEILIAHFSHSGEVVDYNTLIVLSFNNEKVKVVWEGKKNKNSIVLDDFDFENFKRKLDTKYKDPFVNFSSILFRQNSFDCYINKSYSSAVFNSLKNLTFF